MNFPAYQGHSYATVEPYPRKSLFFKRGYTGSGKFCENAALRTPGFSGRSGKYLLTFKGIFNARPCERVTRRS